MRGVVARWEYARVNWSDHTVHLTCTDPQCIDRALADLRPLYPESIVDRRQAPAEEAIHLRLDALQGRGFLAGERLVRQLGRQGWDLFQVDAPPSKRNEQALLLTYHRSGYYHFRRRAAADP